MWHEDEMEIVFVQEGFHLLDAMACTRPYRRRDGMALATGYYIVSWPHGRDANGYGEDAVFRGPFKRQRDAQTNLDRFRAMLHGRPDAPVAPMLVVQTGALSASRSAVT